MRVNILIHYKNATKERNNVTTNSHLSPLNIIAALFKPGTIILCSLLHVCAMAKEGKDKKNAKLASYKFILILLRGLFYYYLI